MCMIVVRGCGCGEGCVLVRGLVIMRGMVVVSGWGYCEKFDLREWKKMRLKVEGIWNM